MRTLLLFLILFSVNILATNTEGILTFDEKELNVGGIYKFNLILVPYEYEELENFKDLAGKNFLDFFYINEIERVKRSENNTDAVVITGNLVILKKIGNKPFYIATHRDLNFPVRIGNVRTLGKFTSSGNKESFFKVGKLEDEKVNYKWWWLIVIAGIVIVLAFKKVLKNKDHVILSKYSLETLNSLEEAILLYENKKTLEQDYPDHLESLNDIVRDVEHIVFAPKDNELNYDLINQKIEIIKRSSDGA